MSQAQSTSTTNRNMSKPMVNGEKLPSQTLDHIHSYKLTNDIITLYDSTTLGHASVQITQAIYGNIVGPFLPLFRTPYSYISPYVNQADGFGEYSLNTFDDVFPAAKDTGIDDLKHSAHSAAVFPFRLANETKGYVIDVYQDEYQKTARENDGRKDLRTMLWAMFSAELRIANESFKAVSNYLAPKREQAKGKYEDFKKRASERAEQGKKHMDEQVDKADKKAGTFLNYTQDQINGVQKDVQHQVNGIQHNAEVEFRAGQDHVTGTETTGAGYADAVKESVKQFEFEANQKLPVEGNY